MNTLETDGFRVCVPMTVWSTPSSGTDIRVDVPPPTTPHVRMNGVVLGGDGARSLVSCGGLLARIPASREVGQHVQLILRKRRSL